MTTFAKPYIGIALGITSQKWGDTGLAIDPATAPSDSIEETTMRITALLLIRICAWIMPRGMFTDLSTTTMCRSMLINDSLWPEALTEDVVAQLKDYVQTILTGYNGLPYHSFHHSYHVTISTNKLVDMIVHQYPNEKKAKTFGFRDDPLMQFCMVFSALIHDVDHRYVRCVGVLCMVLVRFVSSRLVVYIYPSHFDFRNDHGMQFCTMFLTTSTLLPEGFQIASSHWTTKILP